MSDFKVSIDVKSMKVELSLTQLKHITQTGTRQAFYQIGQIARNTIKENISRLPRYGNVNYYRGKRRRASVPGESFANRSKDAQNTLGYDVRGANYLEFGFRENSKTEYVKYLEEGTRNIISRPTMQIASKETQGIAQGIMDTELMKAHEKAII